MEIKMVLRNLTEAELATLTANPKVRRIAVENFCGSMGGLTAAEAGMNLSADAASYKWNAPTRAAIERGIRMGAK